MRIGRRDFEDASEGAISEIRLNIVEILKFLFVTSLIRSRFTRDFTRSGSVSQFSIDDRLRNRKCFMCLVIICTRAALSFSLSDVCETLNSIRFDATKNGCSSEFNCANPSK